MSDLRASSSPTVHTIRFEIGSSSEPDVTIVIDDRSDLVSSIAGDRWIGLAPSELFAADLPLMPTRPPHRAAIARCSCGVIECANVTALISCTGPDQELVRWSDFRDLGAAVSSPSIIDAGLDLDRTPPIAHGDVLFDRLQYENALLTTSTARTWETPAIATARLLHSLLTTEAALLATLGYRLDWVAPSRSTPGSWLVAAIVPAPYRTPEQWRMDVLTARAEEGLTGEPRERLRRAPLRLRPWEHAPHQLVLALSTTDGPPATQAADLYRQLLAVPIAAWGLTFPWTTAP